MPSKESTTEQVRAVADKYHVFVRASKSVFKKYEAAVKEMETRFEILDADLEFRFNRNPIHHIETRIKKPKSVFEKMVRYEKPLTLASMEENVLDIAGVRVIVSYIDDVYALVKVLSMQDDLEIIKIKDYIANPKPNGYRSLHVIAKIPINFLDRKQCVPVEIQFRTIAMDFWASLEHTLKYKNNGELEGIDMFDELKNCSDIITDVEHRMQILMHAVQTNDVEEAARQRRNQLKEQAQEVEQAKINEAKIAEVKASEAKTTKTKTAGAKVTESKTVKAKVAGAKTTEAKTASAKTKTSGAKAAKAKTPEAKTAKTKTASTKEKTTKTAQAKETK